MLFFILLSCILCSFFGSFPGFPSLGQGFKSSTADAAKAVSAADLASKANLDVKAAANAVARANSVDKSTSDMIRGSYNGNSYRYSA